MNNVCLMGRLTADPRINYHESGLCVAQFNVAVKRPVNKDREGGQLTDFFYCVAYNRTAELIGNTLSKGKRILITQATLCNNNYKDSNGICHYHTEVHIHSFDYVDGKEA